MGLVRPVGGTGRAMPARVASNKEAGCGVGGHGVHRSLRR